VENVQLVFLHDWSTTCLPFKATDEARRTLTGQHQVRGLGSRTAIDWFEKQPCYYLENSAEMLDAPGEWFLSPKKGVLSYRP
jgi:hypothetical protein